MHKTLKGIDFVHDKVPYTINNFRSGYLSRVHPDARNVLHAGEIDPAIHSLARDDVESVIAVDVNPIATAVGIWKKEAIRQLDDPLDYAALLSHILDLHAFDTGYVISERQEQIKSDAHRLNHRILEKLPQGDRTRLNQFFELPEQLRGDNGSISNLGYLERRLYDTMRNRLERLDIQTANVFDLLSVSGVDLLSMNNIFDYVEGDLARQFQQLAASLNRDGRLAISSVNARKSGIKAYISNSRIRLPVRLKDEFSYITVIPEGDEVPLSECLRHYGLEPTDDPVLTNSTFENAPATLCYSIVGRSLFTLDEARVEIYRKA